MERLRALAREYQELKEAGSQASDEAVGRTVAVAENLPVDAGFALI